MLKAHDLQDRIQRADSWLRAADRLALGQAHEAFPFHYIALNAMYGRHQYEGSWTEVREHLDRFWGHRDPSASTRRRLAKALGAPVRSFWLRVRRSLALARLPLRRPTRFFIGLTPPPHQGQARRQRRRAKKLERPLIDELGPAHSR